MTEKIVNRVLVAIMVIFIGFMIYTGGYRDGQKNVIDAWDKSLGGILNR